MSSLWIAAFPSRRHAALLAPQRRAAATPLQIPLVLCVLVGFGGILLMMRPSLEGSQGFAGIVGMVSSMATALAYMQVVALSRLGEPEGAHGVLFRARLRRGRRRRAAVHRHLALARLAGCGCCPWGCWPPAASCA